jgi:hypothetical protein
MLPFAMDPTTLAAVGVSRPCALGQEGAYGTVGDGSKFLDFMNHIVVVAASRKLEDAGRMKIGRCWKMTC